MFLGFEMNSRQMDSGPTIRWSRLEIQPELPRVGVSPELRASCSAQSRYPALVPLSIKISLIANVRTAES